jgi:tetratricopeptide (TPR) repeat protein
LAGIERSLAFAERALGLDPEDPQALELRGTVRYWHWMLNVIPDQEEAEALLRRAQEDLEAAIDFDPSLASAHSTLSHLYYQTGQLTSAALSAQLAYEADAYLSVANEVLWRLFSVHYDTERLTQARGWCDEGHQRFPDDYRFWECKLWELSMPAVTPDISLAWGYMERSVELAPQPQQDYQRHRLMMGVAEVLARANLPDSSRNVLVRARAGADIDPNLDLNFLEARVRTVLGDYDEAIGLLRQFLTRYSFEDPDEAEEWASHWWWRDLQSHPDFRELIETAG